MRTIRTGSPMRTGQLYIDDARERRPGRTWASAAVAALALLAPLSAAYGQAMSPTIAKAFGAATIPIEASTTLTFTIGNPNVQTPLNGLAFTDTLPA
ncbi:MAG TPA: hypothetical protein VLW17_11020, partial [Thermoanaerobaculaceae bacterium]|nr:hypothetical protein [Thermoanaerobaculaceae bacterium]